MRKVIMQSLGIMTLVVSLAYQTIALSAGDDHGSKKFITKKAKQSPNTHSVTGQKDTEELESDAKIPSEKLPKMTTRISSSYVKLPRDDNQPWQLLRKLQKQQDLIVAGAPNAVKAYRALLISASQRMLALDADVWSIERNLDAAALYLLIGGNAEVGKIALMQTKLGDVAKHPLKAVIAFDARNYNEAYRLMSNQNPAALPPSLAGQFAIARAILTSSSDIELTSKYLTIARALSPGTLIEEAAIRRQIRIFGLTKNYDELKVLGPIYMRRFGKSHFLNDFIKSYTFALVHMENEVENEIVDDFKKLENNISKQQLMDTLPYVARSSLILGKTKLAYWSASKFLENNPVPNQLHSRMKLYFAAAGIIDRKQRKQSLMQLTDVEMELLNANDKKLYDAVKKLSQNLMQEPMSASQIEMLLSKTVNKFPGEDNEKSKLMVAQGNDIKSNLLVGRYTQISSEYETAIKKASR